MKVFKFGGASVSDANSVKNLRDILLKFNGEELVIVVSAMGKSTNALEEVLALYFSKGDYLQKIQDLKDFHINIMNALFPNQDDDVFDEVDGLFLDLECFLEKEGITDFDYAYDQVVSTGELVSTRIVQAFLSSTGFKCRWMDARNFVITKPIHREARIEWDRTEYLIQRKLLPIVKKTPVITQGFIGGTMNKATTTLGREGSDFSASIFAYALDADEVVLWKDVDGVLNADPKFFKDTIKFDTLSYQDAVEMTFYGARVLHPKTIKPLQNKNIPLHVRSFLKPKEKGTLIHDHISAEHKKPTIILKENQIMISVSTLDYSFIMEENLGRIFTEMAKSRIKSNVMQNSAISFSFCTDNQTSKIEQFTNALKDEYAIKVHPLLSLITIRNFDDETVSRLSANKNIYLEQRNGQIIQLLVGDE